MTTTSLIEIAEAAGRDYVTPEDVQDAIDGGVPMVDLWQELLGILGGATTFGLEDRGLCCFVAHRFTPTRPLPSHGSTAPGVYFCRVGSEWTVARVSEHGIVTDVLDLADRKVQLGERVDQFGGKIL